MEEYLSLQIFVPVICKCTKAVNIKTGSMISITTTHGVQLNKSVKYHYYYGNASSLRYDIIKKHSIHFFLKYVDNCYNGG